MYFVVAFFLSVAMAEAATYMHPTYHFSFEYNEKHWEVIGHTSRTATVNAKEETLAIVQRKNSDDRYRARFTIVMDKPAASLNKDPYSAYKAHALEFLRGQRFRIRDSQEVSLAGVKENAFEILAEQRDFGLAYHQVVLLHQERAFLLTATTRIKKFDDYRSEIRGMLDTFKFLP